jgi:hypothetical protein
MAIYLFCRGELVTAFESNVFEIGTWNLQRWSSVHGGRYLGSCHCRLHNHSGRLPWREQASQCHHVAKPPHRPSSHRGNCVYIRFNVLSRNMAGICQGRFIESIFTNVIFWLTQILAHGQTDRLEGFCTQQVFSHTF